MNEPDAAVRGIMEVDRLVHEPARLAILTVLAEAEDAEFGFVQTVTGLTRGNLSSHAAKLSEAGYIEVTKAFRGSTPVTTYRITDAGRGALASYRASIRAIVQPDPSGS